MNRKHQDQQIGKYIFPSSTISKMDRLIEKTYNSNKEHAFTLCLDKPSSKIYPGQEHVEDKNNEIRHIKFDTECRERGHKSVGTFHTHVTTKSSEPSALDLHSNCHERNDISCIGSPVDGKVTCMVKLSEQANCQYKIKPLVKDEDILLEKNEGDEDKIYSEVDRVMKENFKTEEIKLR